MLRYLRKLADRDLALDRAMIPLGSCTMKLKATEEMIPVTWPEFGALHPFAPAEQRRSASCLPTSRSTARWRRRTTGPDRAPRRRRREARQAGNPPRNPEHDAERQLGLRAFATLRFQGSRGQFMISNNLTFSSVGWSMRAVVLGLA